ncbi:MAG TPA: NfeD family protein [Planctomycetota bacterium]|nr:NfeD family protein [Planctomycetota bacterium]
MKSLAVTSLLALLAAAQAPSPKERLSRVVTVPIEGEIDVRNVALVLRATREALESKPDLVVFEIDTPGGRGDYMVTIGEAIMGLQPIPTAAYVRPRSAEGASGGAFSAGAYIALSCQRIYMHPGTVIGAAAPIMMGPSGPVEMGEKAISAFRQKFRARAEQNGYPPNLAVAMVDTSLELFEVTVDGRKRYLTKGEIEQLWTEGKRFDVPKEPFDPSDKLLTLTAQQVEQTGLGRVVSSGEAIYSDFGLSSPQVTAVVPSWSETLVGLVTSGVVSMLLLVVGVVGLWIEFKTPGFGLPGVVGVAALLLYFFGHHLAGLAEMTEIVLFVLGVGLILLEIFVFPGFGIFGIVGGLCALGGLILSLQNFTFPDSAAPWEVGILIDSVGRVMAAFAGAAVLFMLALRFLPKVPFAGRLVLQSEISGAAPAPAGGEGLAGRKGHAVTPLRPGGKIDVDGHIHDVVAEGEFVAPGEPVEVVRVEGMRVVVARVKR